MSVRHAVTFHEVLDLVESLPEHERENLVDIIRHRLIDQRREAIAKGIREAKKEYKMGETHRGTVEDLMKEIAE